MSSEFRDGLVMIAQRATAAAPRCKNEESAKLFLVLPFITFLGYDPTNPHEVYPEHHADFSEKYKNRVDFAIFRGDDPVIAIECKGIGQSTRDDRGQLRSYFNACLSVKMGVLTDGLVWEFFTDTDEPNIMDDQPFLRLDLRKVAEGQVDDSAIETLKSLHKAAFDPENIGAEARRKHIFNSVIRQIQELSAEPSEEFCRMLLVKAGLKHVRQKALGELKAIVQQAFREFINQQILARLALPGQQQVRAELQPQLTASAAPEPVAPEEQSGIITTERELEVFRWVQQRLAFLVRDEKLFGEIRHVIYRDFQGSFAVFYKWERKGRLFDFIESRADAAAVRYRFRFPQDIPGLPKEVVVKDLIEIDDPLISAFRSRVSGPAKPDAKAETVAQ